MMSNLKSFRTKSKLTQKELAVKADVHINIISRIERGERDTKKITLETAAKLAKALNIHAEDLIEN